MKLICCRCHKDFNMDYEWDSSCESPLNEDGTWTCGRCQKFDPLGIGANEFDPIEHPSHYTSHPSGIECITITQHHNFCIGSAIKYLWRCGLKDNVPVEQDLRKAIQYINFELERLKQCQTRSQS